MNGHEKLGKFLKDISNWYWDEFVRAEKSKNYTTNEAIIFALIRNCAMQNLPAIKTTLNRLDGKLKTPVKIEMPKVFYLFPNATLEAPAEQPALTDPDPAPPADVVTGEVLAPEPEPELTDADLPSMTMRETLAEMANYPRTLPDAIVDLALKTEQSLRGQAPRPDEIPRVKSVVAAHLLIMAQNRNMDAITEVFDQIDGKLAETIQLLGDDLYITIYSPTAPPGAYLNDNGVLQIEAEAAQALWAQKLGAKHAGHIQQDL